MSQNHLGFTRLGFTLLELLLVLAIIAALAGLALPLVQRLALRSQVRSTAQELQSLLYRTRQEAMKSGQAMIFRYRYDSPVYEVLPKDVFDRREQDREGLGAVATGPEMLDEAAPSEMEVADGVYEKMLPHNIIFGSAPPLGASSDAVESALDGDPLADANSADTGLQSHAFEYKDPAEVLDDGWSPPILFFPNGRTSQTTLDIRTATGHRFSETLFLRGLTGTAGLVEKK